MSVCNFYIPDIEINGLWWLRLDTAIKDEGVTTKLYGDVVWVLGIDVETEFV